MVRVILAERDQTSGDVFGESDQGLRAALADAFQGDGTRRGFGFDTLGGSMPSMWNPYSAVAERTSYAVFKVTSDTLAGRGTSPTKSRESSERAVES